MSHNKHKNNNSNQHTNENEISAEHVQESDVKEAEPDIIIEVADTAKKNNAAEDSLKKEIEALKSEVAKYKNLADENFKRYQYSVAELENFKKRVRQEKEEYRKYGIIPFVQEIIHVVDNLEKALEHLENADKDSLTQGIQLTIDQFNKTLKQFGITHIPAVGELFNPNVHYALSMMESAEHEPNKVVDELQKGYILDDRLVRPSKVVVSTALKNVSNEKIVEEEEQE